MKRKIFNLILILFIGGLGGVLANQFLFPYLATFPFLNQLAFIREAGQQTTIVNKSEEIIITENTALEEAIKKISPSVVVVQSYSGKKLLQEGSGFILTSDGLVVTAADLIPEKASQYLVWGNWGQSPEAPLGTVPSPAKVQQRDIKNNLALLKIDQPNLPVISMANLADLDLGARIVLIGVQMIDGHFSHFVNIGTIRAIEDSILRLNLAEEDNLANGGPLVNIKGEVIGLNLVDEQGLVKTVPITKIKY